MKKIVALVLSLVMVLGLATTAFATTPAYLAKVSDGLGTPYTTIIGVDYPMSDYTFSLEKQVDEIGVTRTFAKYVLWATEKDTKAPTAVANFVAAASAESANYAFVDGANITYLRAYNFGGTTPTWDKGYEVALVPTVDEADAAVCGDMYTDGDYAVYADAAANLYVEMKSGTITGYVDGKMVKLVAAVAGSNFDFPTAKQVAQGWTTTDGDLVLISHAYDYDAKTVDGNETVTKVFCKACKAEFEFVQGVEAKAIAKFGAGNYVMAIDLDDTNAVDPVWAAKVPAGAATDAPAVEGDKVESAETFDAGIAMYVGMSVMAAAGSAVVLKKKD